MTLFMTSCGGKKSSRNCGRILDTTRASLGKPFRILQTGNPRRTNDDRKLNECSYCMMVAADAHFGNYKPTEVKDEVCFVCIVCFNKSVYTSYINRRCAGVCVPVKEHRDPLHGNNDRLAVWGLRVRVGGATGRAGFLLA